MTKFCADIHNNLSITLTNEGIKVGPCCWYKKNIIEKTLNKNFWNSPELIELRNLNKQDRLDTIGCSQCIMMEENGKTSRRTGMNSYYNSTDTDLSGPRGLEISIDYTCNLACIMCSPGLSTQWRLELKTPKDTYPIRMQEPDIIALLDQIDLGNLDNIHFYGGDPFFTRTHETILEYIDNRIGLSNLYVWYNTNGTLRVPERVFDLWNKCRLIKVFFSIDDVGKRFEYIRYGAIWNQVEDNMYWYRDMSPVNTMFTIQPTLNCLNALNHYELLAWKKVNFETNRLGDSTDLTRHNSFGQFELKSMPAELVQKCLEKNSSDSWYVDFLKGFNFTESEYQKTKAAIKELDARRGCDFAKTFPELVGYFL